MEVGDRHLAGIAAAVASATLVALLAFAPSALGAFGFTGLQAAPTDPAAGAHSQFNVQIGFTDPQEDVKDLTIHLPPGLVGDPTSVPLCTPAQLNADNCPAASQIGTTTTAVDAVIVVVPVPLTIQGSVYNVRPQPGEPARLGIVLRPVGLPGVATIVLQSGASLRPDDFGLDTTLTNLPNTANGLIPIDIKQINLSLNGAFMRNPTSCGTKTTEFEATSYVNPNTTVTGSSSWESVNCEALPFSPEFSGEVGAPGQTTGGTKPPQTTVISQDEDEAGLETAEVILPFGVSGDSNYLGNTCTMEQFEAGNCPDPSIVGQAEAESPLLEDPLTGPVALISNLPDLPLIGLDLQGALQFRLLGPLGFAETPEGISNNVKFEGLPDIPISRFKLNFVPDRLNTLGRDICVPPPPLYRTTFTSHADEVLAGQTEADVAGCGGEPPGDDPTANMRLRKATSNPRLTLNVRAGSEQIDRVSLRVPGKLRLRRGSYVARADGARLPKSAISRNGQLVGVAAGGAERVLLKLAGGALDPKPSLDGGDRLRFTTRVTDAEGATTRIVKRLRARR
jgi:hypothetical protein